MILRKEGSVKRIHLLFGVLQVDLRYPADGSDGG